MIKVGNTNVSALKVGSTNVSAAYLNGEQVFGGPQPVPWYTTANYVYAQTNDWNGNTTTAWGWLPVNQFSLDIDSVAFFFNGKLGNVNNAFNLSGECLCTANNHNSCTVQDHIGGSNLVMLTARVYNSSNASSGDYRSDFAFVNDSQFQYSIGFSENAPSISCSLNVAESPRWITGSSSQYNSARQYRDSSNITYVRFAFAPTYNNVTSRKIHNFYVMNNGVKVIDVIPILIISTNKYALYDKISGNYIDHIATDSDYSIDFRGE